ncbi:MAG TPA: CPBP family intramembrane glutamic endopeptidase [Terracidiphilus sp.]|jgi:membrane protease YdiL (CAAX protease family)|nr:CPBP family intramembrane glutamic endopeptidase [Terracidiphilus sp.]
MSPGLRFSPTDSDPPKLPLEFPAASPPPEPAQGPGKSPIAWVQWAFLGENGLRSGWAVVLFYLLYRLFSLTLGSVALAFHPQLANFAFSAVTAIAGESIGLTAIVGAVLIVARLQQRSILDYYFREQHPGWRFWSGAVAGFLTLSALVGTLWAGHWLQFNGTKLSVPQMASYAALWAIAFLLTGFLEEGTFRCFLLNTLERGINFWWAFAVVSAVCMRLLATEPSSSAWGVYLMALLGLVPCLVLHHLSSKSAGFWQAAWVTSTLFGFWHTGNHGENPIGIFAAAAIGLVFCVSVRLTGSAWWAIGCHTAWDWAETYFYGTPDSGLVAEGHLFSTQPLGSPVMSGGTVGPEGSLMALVIITVLLIAILIIYRRRQSIAAAA